MLDFQSANMISCLCNCAQRVPKKKRCKTKQIPKRCIFSKWRYDWLSLPSRKIRPNHSMPRWQKRPLITNCRLLAAAQKKRLLIARFLLQTQTIFSTVPKKMFHKCGKNICEAGAGVGWQKGIDGIPVGGIFGDTEVRHSFHRPKKMFQKYPKKCGKLL